MLPPRLPGQPLIGNMREFRRDPVACIGRGYRELGPIFRLRLGPKQVVVMIGPEYHRRFYRETDKSLSTPEIYRFLTPMFGQVLGACPFNEYKEQRRAIAPFFAKRFAAGHVGIMARETEDLLRSLGERGEFELWETAEHLALTIAAKAVLGADFWSRSAVDFYRLFRDIARGMDYILPPNLPLPRFLRRNRARKQLYAAIEPLIVQCRRHGDGFDDLFRNFALATYADGRLLPMDTVIGLILIMIHGAYETVAAQASWCLVDLVSRLGLCNEILAELRGVGLDGAAELTAAGLARLPLLKSVVQESARLRPAATVVCRYAAAPLTVGEFTIAQGTLVMICPGVAHRLPEVFREPEAFVADRFLDVCFDPEQYLTFGGGLHRCMGPDFAIAEIMVICAALLRRYDIELATALPESNYDMSVTRPAPPCNVSYRLRRSSAPHAGHLPENDAVH